MNPPLDFTTALGRLLRDGALREAFAREPSRVADQFLLASGDREAFLRLSPADLEIQAGVLLRKRLCAMKAFIPRTLARLDERAWILFARCGRELRPRDSESAQEDAWQFCQYVSRILPGRAAAAEVNRLRFLRGKLPCAIFYIRDGLLPGKVRRGWQVLIRRPRPPGFREWAVYLGW